MKSKTKWIGKFKQLFQLKQLLTNCYRVDFNGYTSKRIYFKDFNNNNIKKKILIEIDQKPENIYPETLRRLFSILLQI